MSRMKKRSEVSCSKGRANSSFPVGCNPSKSSKTVELETSYNPMKDSEDKVMHKDPEASAFNHKAPDCGKSLQKGYLLDKKGGNNQYQKLMPSSGIEAQQGVQEEIYYCLGTMHDECIEEPADIVQEFDSQQGEDPHSQHPLRAGKRNTQDADKMAMELLATRAFTAFELRKKLQAKNFPLNIVNTVIMDLLSRGFINDSLYAETFSRSRWSSSSWGPRRIKQALLKKGICEVDAEKAIKLVFVDSDPKGDQESILGLSKVSMDHLFVQASRQWLRSQNIPSDTRKARVIRWLQYRGFNWGIIGFILKKLEAEDPP